MNYSFKDGDRVRHIGRQEVGTVKMLADGVVQVTFDKPTPSGCVSVGEYDEVWFRTHPNWLLHESTPPVMAKER